MSCLPTILSVDGSPSDIGDSSTGVAPPPAPEGVPSNAVYDRVGDVIKQAAREGVCRGLTPQEIVREIIEQHGIHITVGELRLLLASRRVSK